MRAALAERKLRAAALSFWERVRGGRDSGRGLVVSKQVVARSEAEPDRLQLRFREPGQDHEGRLADPSQLSKETAWLGTFRAGAGDADEYEVMSQSAGDRLLGIRDMIDDVFIELELELATIGGRSGGLDQEHPDQVGPLTWPVHAPRCSGVRRPRRSVHGSGGPISGF